jgi:hypothetical protein
MLVVDVSNINWEALWESRLPAGAALCNLVILGGEEAFLLLGSVYSFVVGQEWSNVS